MPGASSIYWNSVGSHRSSESSGDTGSGRQYVDPWDLENYAYLRRHSVATAPTYQTKKKHSKISHRRSEIEPEYWYAPSHREPGYHAPASVDEIYFGSSKSVNPNSHYQPISEIRNSQYTPLYQPLSDLDYQRFEDLRIKEVPKRRKVSRAKVTASDLVKKREIIYHNTSSNNRRDFVDKNVTLKKKILKNEDDCYVEVVPVSKFGLTKYGHLKIDYTNSWNSLNRKISK